MRHFREFITYNTLILSLFVVGEMVLFESCTRAKSACGTKRQKKARHKRIKSNTTFMTY
ncbi:MAG: hypothetical protein J0M08_10290 [Bacteroidetes bacterium]|nr:hypothetical protein [Bacteroidota bacterium]